MKIWMINHYTSMMLQNRVGRHYNFANELERRGHDVTVFWSSSSLRETGGVIFFGK